MYIDRPMASIFFQIKRSMPFDAREEMKISSPNVGENLIALYNHCEDKALKSMIEGFMERAGGEWKSQLKKSSRARLINAFTSRPKH